MHKITLFILSAVFAVALAGQYYIPRAYYTIDAEGHESARVPLRRLRRSLQPYFNRPPGGSADANSVAINNGGGEAHANSYASNGGWGGYPEGISNWQHYPAGNNYGSSKPLGFGETRSTYGAAQGRSVSAVTSVGLGTDGNGYYYQSASNN